MSEKAVYTTKKELFSFLYFLEFLLFEENILPMLLHTMIYALYHLIAYLINHYTNTLFVDTDPIIQEFLHHDTSFRLADKYLIAMVFIYFKRAQLGPDSYTPLNFFAGLCLAHSMEEDIELSSEIYPWALGIEMEKELPILLELKTLLWVAMDYRAAVSKHCCKQLITISASHSVWQRKRSPFRMIHSLSINPVFEDSTTKYAAMKGKGRRRKKILPD